MEQIRIVGLDIAPSVFHLVDRSEMASNSRDSWCHQRPENVAYWLISEVLAVRNYF